MARARNIKPGFFINEDLVELSFSTRLLFIGLWTIADREGRLDDRPRKIKMAVFPADEVDIAEGLTGLSGAGLIQRYIVDNKPYIQIVNFTKHQSPHIKEPNSLIPAPDVHQTSTVLATLNDESLLLIPDSSVSKETAKASDRKVKPTPKNPSSDLTIWDTGVAALDPDGSDPKGTRGYLGRLIKDYTEENVAKALGSVLLKRPADPKSYISGILKNTNGHSASYTYVQGQPTQREAIAEEQARIAKEFGS